MLRVHAPMREEHPSSQEDVRTLSRQPLKPLEDRRIHSPRAELVDEFVVVDRELFPIVCYSTLDVPRRDDLSVCVFLGGFYRWSMCAAVGRWCPMRCRRYLL